MSEAGMHQDGGEPRHLVVHAQGAPSPLYEAADGDDEDTRTFTRNVPLDDAALGLPDVLAQRLRSWSQTRPADGFRSRPELRKHVKAGLSVARPLAKHLGPGRAVRYWDERHRTMKFVCWGCSRLHWTLEAHGSPPHPLHLTVEGEFKYGPLRSDGLGDFLPDDPAAALDLPDELVSALHTWADEIDTTVNLDLRDREGGKYDTTWQRLFNQGMELARQVAHELGPNRTVTYRGLANGGLSAMTSVTWQGDRQV